MKSTERITSAGFVLLAMVSWHCRAEISDQLSPQPSSVEPNSYDGSVEQMITIRGENLLAAVSEEIDDPLPKSLNTQFQVTLGPVPLTNVTYVDGSTLTAVVPANLPSGVYDLTVVGPYGLVGHLSAAFRSLPLLVAADPFADGSSVVQVLAVGDNLMIGPDATGSLFMRADASGTNLVAESLNISADVTPPVVSSNQSGGPYHSIGSADCEANSSGCGPDNETGVALVAALGDDLWLGGLAANGNARYLYTGQATTPLDLSYVDLSQALTSEAVAPSAIASFAGATYIGWQANGNSGPLLVRLSAAVAAPGLDASVPNELFDVEAEYMPHIGTLAESHPNPATPTDIDALVGTAQALYVLNNGGCLGTTNASPHPYATLPSDWFDCTPNAQAFASQTAVTRTTLGWVPPSQRAVVATAIYKNALWFGRNTSNGPQLWQCSASADGTCQPSDWQLVAANDAGNESLSQLNQTANTSLSLLVATSNYLWIGFDNGNGVELYRTNVANPGLGDFVGLSSCSAASADCQGLAGPGLGDVGNVRFLSSTALTDGDISFLFVVVGNGSEPVKIYRFAG